MLGADRNIADTLHRSRPYNPFRRFGRALRAKFGINPPTFAGQNRPHKGLSHWQNAPILPRTTGHDSMEDEPNQTPAVEEKPKKARKKRLTARGSQRSLPLFQDSAASSACTAPAQGIVGIFIPATVAVLRGVRTLGINLPAINEFEQIGRERGPEA